MDREKGNSRFNSHSGISYLPYKEYYVPKNRESELKKTDDYLESYIELIHEQTHWMQHIGTGFGALINHLRMFRDECIIQAIRENKIPFELIEARIDGTDPTPLFKHLTLEETFSIVVVLKSSNLSLITCLWIIESRLCFA